MEYSVEDFKKYILGEPGECYYPHGSVYRCLPEAVEYSFCEANDFEYFQIGMYHGTDRFVWEMDALTRKQYMDALKTYADACCKNEELDTFLSAEVKRLNAIGIDYDPIIGTYSMLKSLKNKDSMYEYQSLYFTPHLGRAKDPYAKRGRRFGEIGNLALTLWNYTEQGNIRIETDSETERLLEEWYRFATERKPEPIVIKLKPEAFDKIDATEEGVIFDAKGILDFKYQYLNSTLSKFDPNDINHALKINDILQCFIGFRIGKKLTENDFTVLEWQETERECERTIENKDRLKKEYLEYVDRFCVEHEKSLNDEEYVKGLKEHFGLKTYEEAHPKTEEQKENERKTNEWFLELILESEAKNNETIQ